MLGVYQREISRSRYENAVRNKNFILHDLKRTVTKIIHVSILYSLSAVNSDVKRHTFLVAVRHGRLQEPAEDPFMAHNDTLRRRQTLIACGRRSGCRGTRGEILWIRDRLMRALNSPAHAVPLGLTHFKCDDFMLDDRTRSEPRTTREEVRTGSLWVFIQTACAKMYSSFASARSFSCGIVPFVCPHQFEPSRCACFVSARAQTVCGERSEFRARDDRINVRRLDTSAFSTIARDEVDIPRGNCIHRASSPAHAEQSKHASDLKFLTINERRQTEEG